MSVKDDKDLRIAQAALMVLLPGRAIVLITAQELDSAPQYADATFTTNLTDWRNAVKMMRQGIRVAIRENTRKEGER